MMNADKEEQILRKRLLELANTAYVREIHLFSDFLNLNEQNIFKRIEHELPRIKYFANGGYRDAERKILCFCGRDDLGELENVSYPIVCIKVIALNQKFSDELSHRDFLGAVLNLGIERSKIGDILIWEKEGYIIASQVIAPYIKENLIRVKHTNVSCSITDLSAFDYQPRTKEINTTVASMRLDAVLAVAFRGSRSSLSGLISGGKVFIDGKNILTNSYLLKENEIISVRGYGKFKFMGSTYQTKKGRYSIKLLLFC